MGVVVVPVAVVAVLKVGDDSGVTESAFLSTDCDGAIGRVR